MNSLYHQIRAKNPAGLPYEEAVQLFLWIYCSAEILPPALRTNPPGKEMLVDLFEELQRDNVILGGPTEHADGLKPLPWARLVDELLSKRLALDPDFPARANRYL